MDHVERQKGMFPRADWRTDVREDVVLANLRVTAVTEAIKALGAQVAPIRRCACCWETRYVRPDSYAGVHDLCARCEHQVLATGRCCLHHSPLLYSELEKPGPVESPPEIEALFVYVPPPHPTPPAAVVDGPEVDMDVGP